MIVLLQCLVGWLVGVFRSREDLVLENLALRQQLVALHARRPRRRLAVGHKLFWVGLRRLWSRWRDPLILVTPRTVVRWHRTGFRLYWKWLSRARATGGRRPVSKEIRALIFQMVAENPTWGAPRIHGELLKLGFDVSQPTVSRWARRAPRPTDPAKRWLTFLRNHREAIAAMDFFTVPTLTFGVLYCLFIISHDRRRILHHSVTRSPNALWVALQVNETWEYGEQPALPDLRSRLEVQCWCALDREGDGLPSDSNRIPQPLAKRNCGALGWQCAAGFARSCDRHQPKASATVAERVRPLLPRRPDSSRTREGHSRWANFNISAFKWPQGYLVAATRRVASPLYGRSLSNFQFRTAARIGERFTRGSWPLGVPTCLRDS
jgi:hypothetical protein